jgi:hypothetical protein
MLLAYLPYQWLLGFAALRATWRHVRGFNSWEKTAHIGAHRTPEIARPVGGNGAHAFRDAATLVGAQEVTRG